MAAIEVEGLRRTYKTSTGTIRRKSKLIEAVRGIDFQVGEGELFGLLGPNGAGKTTTIKMLITLLIPTAGKARVLGLDVVEDAREVRKRIGYVFGGERGVYERLSGYDNLRYFAELYGVPPREQRSRIELLLEMVGLKGREHERAEGYSRGMKQRLHLAKALLHDPPILILDEPTIGLDPAAAVDLRRAVANLVPEHTVLLTTHDMYEADQLCREIAIVDRGLIVAQGTPDELKARVAGERRVIVATHQPLNGHFAALDEQLSRLPGVRGVDHELTAAGGTELTILCADTAATLDETLALLRGHGASIGGVRVVEPTLEDAFLAIAGRSFE